MAKTRKAKPADLFTPDEIEIIKAAAGDVWNEIGYDVLTEGMGEDDYARAYPRRGSPSVSRAVVIELVLDADRLFERLRGHKGLSDAFKAKLTYDHVDVFETILKEEFPHGRYGL